jgi:hypothetical protein
MKDGEWALCRSSQRHTMVDKENGLVIDGIKAERA